MSASPSIHVVFVARLLAGEGRRVSDGSATGVLREGANDVELLYFVYLLLDSDNQLASLCFIGSVVSFVDKAIELFRYAL